MSNISKFLERGLKASMATFENASLIIQGESITVCVFDRVYIDVITENGVEKKLSLIVTCTNPTLYVITEDFANLQNELVVLNETETWRIDSITSNYGICTINLQDPI